MLDGLASDPSGRSMIADLQDEAYAAFSAIVDKTAAILMEGAESSPERSPVAPASGPLTARAAVQLALESKHRQQAWQKARELAEMLVIGALVNKDNPGWDPSDPASCRMAGQSTLLSLLQFDGDEVDTQETQEA
jgi:hypothetical protein